MTNSHSDDHWKNLSHRDVSEEEALDVGLGLYPDGPEAAAVAFISALSRFDVSMLRSITDPAFGWGDFRAAQALLEEIPDWGIGSTADYATGREDVAYVKILAHVNHSMQLTEGGIVGAAAVVTLLHTGMRWVARAIGDYWLS